MSLVTQRERLIGLARQWINSASDFEPAVCDTYILCAKEILKTFGQTIPHIDVPERTTVKQTFTSGGPGAMPTAPTTPPQSKEPRQSYYGDGLQPWDLIKSLGMGAQFAAGNVIKYVGRYDKKGGLDDLRKCRWYLDRLIEIIESTTGTAGAESSKCDGKPPPTMSPGHGRLID